jgi:putative flippase GtrA
MFASRWPAARSFFFLASRYLFTAGVSFVIYFAAIFVFFSVAQLPYMLAVAVAYVITLAVHFSMNRSFTFNSGSPAVLRQLLRYGATALLNYFVQIGVIYMLYSRWHTDFYLATLAGLIANLAVGFFLLRRWVFASDGSTAGDDRVGL